MNKTYRTIRVREVVEVVTTMASSLEEADKKLHNGGAYLANKLHEHTIFVGRLEEIDMKRELERRNESNDNQTKIS